MKFVLMIGLLALGSPAMAQAPSAVALGAPNAAGDAAEQRAVARVESHITELHKRLAITPAQETQWAAFATVMRDNARDMERNYKERQGRGTVSAVDDLRGYAAVARLHADNVGRLLPPFEALYAAMTAEQRASADKVFQSFQKREPRRRVG